MEMALPGCRMARHQDPKAGHGPVLLQEGSDDGMLSRPMEERKVEDQRKWEENKYGKAFRLGKDYRLFRIERDVV